MSCIKCDNEPLRGAFYRWKNTNVEIVACQEHWIEIRDVLRWAQRGRVEQRKIREELLLIAARSNNILKVTPARKLLVKAGLLSEGQSGSNKVNEILYKMNEFERVGRGKYHLVSGVKVDAGGEIHEFRKGEENKS